jgi:hypothetical protein
MPIWEQVMPQIKNFFYQVEVVRMKEEKYLVFFNGFYLPHELGHAFQDATNESAIGLSYKNEYLANTIAILWWRKHKRTEELKLCYEYAKKYGQNCPTQFQKI